MAARAFDVDLPSGRIHAEERGDPDAPLAICVHGLSGNLRSFDAIAERLAADAGRRVVAIDLRGRGRSDVTPPGTYGLAAHARDVLALADELGAERFDHAGWSMGALIGMVAASQAPERVRSLALIDHAGEMDPEAVAAVRAALARLDVVVPDPRLYVAAIREAGVVDPWDDVWEGVYRYELGETGGGWSPTTDRAACTEDLDAAGPGALERMQDVWRALAMPTLLVRATAPINGGLVVPERIRDALRAAVPHLRLAEVDRNHYGVMTDPRTASAIVELVAAAERAPAASA